MQPHQQFKLTLGGLSSAGDTTIASCFSNQTGKQSLAQKRKETVSDGVIRKTRKYQYPRELTTECRIHVIIIEAGEFVFWRFFGVVQQGFPLGVPAALEDFEINTINERLLGRKVVVKKGVRDAHASTQIPQLRIKTVFGEETDRAIQDLTLTFGHTQAPPCAGRFGCDPS